MRVIVILRELRDKETVLTELKLLDGNSIRIPTTRDRVFIEVIGVATNKENARQIIELDKKKNGVIGETDRGYKTSFSEFSNERIVYRTDDNDIYGELTDCLQEASDITICGYRASDLVIFAERMRSPERVDDIDNDLLMDNNKAYIDGYNKAHQEIQEQIDRICINIGGFESE